MASKSTGQIIGTVVGAVIGFFAGGNVALGAAIGGAIGGLIDPPKGPTIVGPRLDDLSFQTSTLGAPLGRAYGTVPIIGNVVWLEGDKYREVITSEEQGGKGGSSATYETAHYYATFAVSLLRVTDATKTIALRRMWIGSNLVYDAGSDNIESVIASNSQSPLFAFYGGTDDQQPNSRWQADKGINAVSGFPGRCYIVIYDLDLEPYSRSLAMAQVKVELTVGDAVADIDAAELILPQETNYWTSSMILSADGAEYSRVENYVYYAYPFSATEVSLLFSDRHDVGVPLEFTGISGGTNGYSEIPCTDTDKLISVVKEVSAYPSHDMWLITTIGGTQEKTQVIPDSIVGNIGEHFCCYRASEGLYVFNASYAVPAFRISPGGYGPTVISAGSYQSRTGGLSENYLFLVKHELTGSTTTIYRLNKSDLSLDQTWVGSIAPYNTAISVIDDETIYTAALGHVHKWVSGTVVADIGALVEWDFGRSGTDHPGWFKVISEGPAYVVSWNTIFYANLGDSFKIGHEIVNASVSKMRDIVTSECGLAGLESGDIDLAGLTDSDVRGYRVANAASIRSSLEMLQAAHPFDVAPSGYKLRFVSRGGASLATIPEADLGAVVGGDSFPVLLPSSREMDTQIPYKVSVRYLDPVREYDIAEQYASRPDTASVSERTVELSLVMTGDEAAKAADVLNQKDWLERVSFGPFSIPPTWRELEPPDVVTIEHRGQAHSIRLTRAEFLPDGRIECAGVYSSAQSYTSSATAQESLTIGQILVPLVGSTTGYLLDIPRIRAEQDVPGMSFAMTGLASGWPGGVLLRSDDSGNSYQAVGAANTRAKVFVSGAALAAHHGYTIDNGSMLTVTPRYSGHTLASVTEGQLYAHSNLAAYGADGRWEIVAFRTATDNTGSYTVQDFLRGLYGTEWASGLHVSGDYLIMLDTATVGFFGLPTNAIGAQRLYRSVTQGAALDSAVDVADTYDAANLKPLAPVDLTGSLDQVSSDWTLAFSRRTRWPVELFSGVDVPLGEASEQYQVEIFNSDYSVLKRTVSGLSSPSFSYSLADQTTDFGGRQTTLYLKAYQVSSVVGRGFPLEKSIYRPFSDDPYIDYVVLLMHMDDAGLTDVKGHPITVVGDFARSAAQSVFGGYSGYSDGTGDALTTPSASDLTLGTGDFTVEMWVWQTGTITTWRELLMYNVNSSFNMMLYDGKLAVGREAVANDYVSASAITQNAWHHVAVSRKSGVIYGYVDGNQVFTGAWNYNFAAAIVSIGGKSDGASCINGYIEEIRVTKYARYTTSSITVPAGPFPNP